jgi:hypothetical protein
MTARNQWSQGLQWGAFAWLGYIVLRALGGEVQRLLVVTQTLSNVPDWMCDPSWGWQVATAWVAALVLVAAGSRWARLAVGAAMVLHAVVAGGEAVHCDRVLFVLTRFLPMSVPLLPLLVLRVERPRVVLALAALGRWREARARFGGVGVLAVAAALVSLNHASWDMLGAVGMVCSLEPEPYAALGILWAGVLPVTLFAWAWLVVWATSRRAAATGW